MNAAKILIMSDLASDAEGVANELRSEFSGVATCCSAEQAVDDFERNEPEVLVWAFRDLAQAEGQSLVLRGSSRFARAHPHRTLLLCHTDDIPSAYKLCSDGRFDDYMKFWPAHFDAFRLAMHVLSALRPLRIAKALEASVAELAAQTGRVAAVEPFLAESLSAGDPHVRLAAESARWLGGQLAPLLAVGGASSGTEPQAAEQCRAALEKLNQRIEGLVEWASEQREQSGPHLQSLRAMQQLGASMGTAAGETLAVRQSVLVIDDDEFQQKILARLVGLENLHCDVASTGFAAFESIAKRRPSLILLDYALPDSDGVTLLRLMRSNPDLAAVPIVMLTGNGDKHVVVSCMQAGANEFMVKPINAARLRERLRHFIAQAA